jgi:hypothetical protein
MWIGKSHRLCRVAVFGVFLESVVLHAQTTNPLDLLQEAAAPGERIAYASGDLQFGELRAEDLRSDGAFGIGDERALLVKSIESVCERLQRKACGCFGQARAGTEIDARKLELAGYRISCQ